MRRREEALAVLVGAPAGLVYASLSHIDGWDAWWPGCRTRRDDRADRGGAADHHLLGLPAGRRAVRCRATVDGWRHDEGLRMVLRGGVDADVEWWIQPVGGGAVVHLLVAARGRRAERTVRALGGGLQALKDHLELAVAVASGWVP